MSGIGRQVYQWQLVRLFLIFVLWKATILLVVLLNPGIGYDTSASISSDFAGLLDDTPHFLSSPWLKFIRWDAIYFKHMAEHGHIFEQEWAWGIGLSSCHAFIRKHIAAFLNVNEANTTTIGGLLLSHASHCISVGQLFILTSQLVGWESTTATSVPFRAAALHIFSPAGVFLSAPYAESFFACLSMAGVLAFVYAVHHFNHSKPVTGSILMMTAGLPFGLATVVRGNGTLAGATYLVEATVLGLGLLTQDFSLSRLFRLSAVVAGGLLIAAASVWPQYLAFQEYCDGREPDVRRTWCNRTIPSIFTWVQSHYWNVGPFRYWTVSNIPLFLLAAPALCILIYSAIDCIQNPRILFRAPSNAVQRTVLFRDRVFAISLALPQLLLAVLALTTYHVQIISRLSSGYPLWYIWLANQTVERKFYTSSVIRWMVLYALIQAGLYAAFLPPA